MENRQERRRFAALPGSPARKVPLSRWLLVILGLLAMSAQSLLVQTHVHSSRAGTSHIAAASEAGLETAPLALIAEDDDSAPALPLPDDSLKCPLCQQWQGAGQFTAPAATLLSLPFLVHFSLAVLDDPALAVSVLAHPWHGRAPPQA
jgi:hypothetical protein